MPKLSIELKGTAESKIISGFIATSNTIHIHLVIWFIIKIKILIIAALNVNLQKAVATVTHTSQRMCRKNARLTSMDVGFFVWKQDIQKSVDVVFFLCQTSYCEMSVNLWVSAALLNFLLQQSVCEKTERKKVTIFTDILSLFSFLSTRGILLVTDGYYQVHKKGQSSQSQEVILFKNINSWSWRMRGYSRSSGGQYSMCFHSV